MGDHIYTGDNGTVISFTIKDDKEIVPLTDANISVTIKKGKVVNTKEATIIDSENGVCQIILNEQDVALEGRYVFQITVHFPNGNKFSSNTNQITVLPKLSQN